MVNPYQLSPEENQRVFEEIVLPLFTTNLKSVKNPKFILLTGQPGAGKTSLSNKLSEEMDKNSVVFGADDLRALHPKKADILFNDEANYPELTKADSGIWRRKLMQHCFDNNYNILVESILNQPGDWNMSIFNDAKKYGYNVECCVLGVDKNLSLLGISRRYEQQKSLVGYGFAPTYNHHDKAYNLLPELADKMLSNKTVDNVRVFNRNLELFYDHNNQQSYNYNVENAISKARKSTLSTENLAVAEQEWREVFDFMKKRNASKQDILIRETLYTQLKFAKLRSKIAKSVDSILNTNIDSVPLPKSLYKLERNAIKNIKSLRR